jgi:hypothetical protein
MSKLAHANKINALFNEAGSNFVSLDARLTHALSNSPVFSKMLDGAVDEFKRRNKKWTKWDDIILCQGVPATMALVQIDTTMQRPVDLRHVIEIINEFSQSMVMPIQTYVPEGDSPFIAWDGQHTILALYIIATRVFGMRPQQCVIPVNVYAVTDKLEIRRNFIMLNGDAKKPLDFIDIFKQMVFGVRIDGADDQEWLDAELKQQYFEQAGLFATNSKFGDEDEPGAFTLLADTLMTTHAKSRKHPAVTKMFCDYWSYLGQERPVAPKEARVLYEYFHACYTQGITVDEDYCRALAGFTKEFFEGNFGEKGAFWDKVKQSYSNWYRGANKHSTDFNTDGEIIVRGFVTEWRVGGPFLIAQISKSTELQTPTFTPNNGYSVKEFELWS